MLTHHLSEECLARHSAIMIEAREAFDAGDLRAALHLYDLADQIVGGLDIEHDEREAA